jgi:hypothetical protein
MQLTDGNAIRKCVVYVGYRKNGDPVIGGTGFFVTYNEALFLVTVKHNLLRAQKRGADKLLIRFNQNNVGLADFETEFSEWHQHPDPFTDVAVMPISDHVARYQMDVIAYPAQNHVNARVIAEIPVTVGDEVFFPGLFSPVAGDDRNVPVVRSGNIAAMSEEKVRVTWIDNSKPLIDAYLVEARSLGGLSGSPVFVHFPWRRRYSRKPDGTLVIKLTAKATEHCLLGLVHGHFDAPLEIDDEQKTKNVNLGMAIVVPFTKVIDVINDLLKA